jgi:UDP-2,3-diacylglucosamine hydrolase
MHGDTLCTDDIEYQSMRAKIRTREWISQVLALPVEKRLSMASQFRMDSQISKSVKSEEIMDVNQNCVEQVMARHGVHLLIHGHTHRPKVHEFVVETSPATRIVLGDWYKTSSVLRFTDQGFSLEK